MTQTVQLGRPRRRWPLLLIGASAGTATWSGWVGLGGLTGFGIVHPLPGIADSLTINTAVTLPIGVEAYAMYALSIATTHRSIPDRTRRYAWASSAAALALGMAGQIAYHLMTATRSSVDPGHVDRLAPWWVIALVSCLPVAVLGAASLLWHLAGEPADETEAPAEPVPPEPQPETTEEPVSEPERTPSSKRRPATVTARPDDLARVRTAIQAGQLQHPLSAKRIRALLAISPAYARAARDALSNEIQNDHHHEPEEMTEPRFSSTADQEAEESFRTTVSEKAEGKQEEQYTYATQLT